MTGERLKSVRGAAAFFAPSVIRGAAAGAFGLMVLAARPEDALAEARLKKLVFEDCSGASGAIPSLGPETRREFLDYLMRVLRMQAGVPAELLLDGASGSPLVGQPNAVLDGLRGQNIWQIFEPSREGEAKRCAARLLAEMAPDSIVAVPTIIAAIPEPTLPSDAREAFEQAMWTIVLAVKGSSEFVLERTIVAELINLLAEDSTAYLAGNVLIELHERTIPILSDELFSSSQPRSDAIRALVLGFDRDGTVIGPKLIELLGSAESSTRVRAASLLGDLVGFRKQAIPALVLHLNDLSQDVTDAVVAGLGRLLRQCSADDRLVLSDQEFGIALEDLGFANGDRRKIAEQILLHSVLEDPARIERIWALTTKDHDDDLRERAIRIAVHSVSGAVSGADRGADAGPHPGAVRREDGDHLLEALYDASPAVKRIAIAGLAAHTSRAEEIGNAFLRMLKGAGAPGAEASRMELLMSVSETMLQLPPVPSRQRMVPYLIETLSNVPSSDGAAGDPSGHGGVHLKSMDLLLQIGREAMPGVLKTLKSPLPIARRRAVIVLGRSGQKDRQTLRPLVDALRDPAKEVRKEVVEQLSRVGSETRPDLERALGQKDPVGRTAVAQVLAALGDRRPELAAILRDAFSAGTCADQVEIFPVLLTLDETFRLKVQPFLFQCALRGELEGEQLLTVLEQVAPLAEDQQDRVFEVAHSRSHDRLLQRMLLERAAGLGISPERIYAFARTLLQGDDITVRGYLLERVARERDLARALLPELQRIAQTTDEQIVFRVAATVAAANIDAGAVEYSKLLLKELEGDRHSSVLARVADLRAELAIPLLTDALRRVSAERRPAIVAALGGFGPQAVGAHESLVPLLENSDPLLRHQAAAALIRIDPVDPDVGRLLQMELVGRYGNQLAEEHFPVEIIPAVEKIIEQPRTFVEQRAAEKLLEELRARHTEPQS